MEKKTIGSLIAALRKANGMTQKDLAERLNVSDKSVSRWERDEGVPDLSLIPVIAEIFGITCDELLRGECKPNPSMMQNGKFSSQESSENNAEGTTSSTEEGNYNDKVKLSSKGEKECKRILQSRMNLYQILSFVGIGITLLGLLITLVFPINNFGYFIGNGIAFWVSTVFYLGSAIFQVIIVFIAFMSVSNNGLDPEEIKIFKYRVIRLGELNFGLIAVCFSFGFPYPLFSIMNMIKFPSRLGYRNGFLAALITAILFSAGCYFVNAFLIRKGICGMKQEKIAAYWHNHKLKRNLVLMFLGTVIVTVFLNNVLTGFGSPYYLAKGTKFQDYESFIEFMEQEVSVPYQYHNEALQASNTIVYLRNFSSKTDTRKKLFKTALHDADWDIQCEYMDANYSVCAIKYMEKKDSILPITVITYEQLHNAEIQMSVCKNIFKYIYILEIAVFLILYYKKRAK